MSILSMFSVSNYIKKMTLSFNNILNSWFNIKLKQTSNIEKMFIKYNIPRDEVYTKSIIDDNNKIEVTMVRTKNLYIIQSDSGYVIWDTYPDKIQLKLNNTDKKLWIFINPQPIHDSIHTIEEVKILINQHKK